MFWYKSCPKCHTGDLALEQDIYGWYRQCVQCGYLEEIANKPSVLPARVAVPVAATTQGDRRAA